MNKKSWLKSLLFGALIWIGLLGVAWGQELRNYEDSSQGIHLSYPIEWKMEVDTLNGEKEVTFLSPDKSSVLMLTYQPVPPVGTVIYPLELSMSESEKQAVINSFVGDQFKNPQWVTVNGRTMIQGWNLDPETGEQSGVTLVVFKKDKVIFFLGLAQDSETFKTQKSLLELSIESFKI